MKKSDKRALGLLALLWFFTRGAPKLEPHVRDAPPADPGYKRVWAVAANPWTPFDSPNPALNMRVPIIVSEDWWPTEGDTVHGALMFLDDNNNVMEPR